MRTPTRIDAALASTLLVTTAVLVFFTGCSDSETPITGGQLLLFDGSGGAASDTVALLEDFSARSVFPANNWWNLDVSGAPVDSESGAIIDWISGRTPSNPTATRIVHPDFGPPPYGIPYVGVGANQLLEPVTFSPYGSQMRSRRAGPPSRISDSTRGEDPTQLHRRRPCRAAARAATAI